MWCICVLFFTLFQSIASCAGESSKEPSPWIWLLPGGAQFYNGQTARGISYAAGTLGLAGWGVLAEKKRTSGEINALFIYAQQVYVLSLYEGYRDIRLRSEMDARKIDPSSIGELVSSPFRWRQLKSPWVLGSLAVGAGLNYILVRGAKGRRSFGDMRRMKYLGGSYNKTNGTLVYSAYWIPISLGAGVTEEALFRGMLQSEWEERWGSGRGLLAASGVFGICHLTDLKDPESWANVGFATLAGLYLGWRFQKTGYRLAEPIAAHFWFNLAAGLTVFFANPKENPLGAKFEFAF